MNWQWMDDQSLRIPIKHIFGVKSHSSDQAF